MIPRHIVQDNPPLADMETLSPEDQAMIDRIIARRGTWIAAAVTVAGLAGLVAAVWWAVKLYVGGV